MIADGLRNQSESADYAVCSDYVTQHITRIMADAIEGNRNCIFIRTNLKRGLPLENINKVAGPFVEAWAMERFEAIADGIGNQYELMNAQAGKRLDPADIILQFKRVNPTLKRISASVDVKATSEDIPNSGKSPNITSYARIRTDYLVDPDYIFIVLSLKHKVYGEKDIETGLTNGIMEVTSCSVYDLKFVSARDLNYNPALGTGQLQIRDIHYVTEERRTVWEFVQMLDEKYIRSKGRAAWVELATKKSWIKENDDAN